MTSIQDILKLCEEEQGKVFILDHAGNLKLVILAAGEYTRLKGGRVTVPQQSSVDIEAVNRQITQAQLADDVQVASKEASFVEKDAPSGLQSSGARVGPVPISSVLQSWHHGKAPKASMPKPGSLMDEVIDLGWDDESNGPVPE